MRNMRVRRLRDVLPLEDVSLASHDDGRADAVDNRRRKTANDETINQ